KKDGKYVDEKGVPAKYLKEIGPSLGFFHVQDIDQQTQYKEVDPTGEEHKGGGPEFFVDGQQQVPGKGRHGQDKARDHQFGHTLIVLPLFLDKVPRHIADDHIHHGGQGAEQALGVEGDALPVVHMVRAHQPKVQFQYRISLKGEVPKTDQDQMVGHQKGKAQDRGGPYFHKAQDYCRKHIAKGDSLQHPKDPGLGQRFEPSVLKKGKPVNQKAQHKDQEG